MGPRERFKILIRVIFLFTLLYYDFTIAVGDDRREHTEAHRPDNFERKASEEGIQALIPTQSRIWTDNAGNAAPGTVTGYDQDTELVRLTLDSGKSGSLPISKLSELDQEFVRNALEAILSGRVVGVHDGDSFTLLVAGNTQFKIRLESIDAPELGQEFGKISKQGLSSLIFGKQIRVLVTGKDKYGRYLGIPTIGGVNVNHEMVLRGHAWHFKEYSDSQELAKAEETAKAGKLGLWSGFNPMSPWDYRVLQKRKAFEKSNKLRPSNVSSLTTVMEEGESGVKNPGGSFWLNTSSGARHNDGCRWFGQTKRGRYCSETEGKACDICGG